MICRRSVLGNPKSQNALDRGLENANPKLYIVANMQSETVNFKFYKLIYI